MRKFKFVAQVKVDLLDEHACTYTVVYAHIMRFLTKC